MDETAQKKSLNVPVAIVIAGVLIAGAVFMNKTPSPATDNSAAAAAANQEISIRPLSSSDHILGNPTADIVIVEYSDLECPFCKVFHQTMHQLIDEYGKSGKLAWVYRQFPLAELHSKAPMESEASECAAELGGNAGFWKFIDTVFAVTPSNNGLDPAQLPKIAKDIGLNENAFNTCLTSGKYATKIKAAYDEAFAAGARGTPYSVIISGSTKIPIDGAQPYTAVKAAIETLLAQKNGPVGQQAVPTLTPQSSN
ncbi:MAG TPA: thioredoxin domain-containing protein [Candidatus Paceibacterota bacterium]